MSFIALFRPFQCVSLCLAWLIPARLSSASASLFASWHEREVVPFLSITAVIACALLANLLVALPHVQPATLSLAFRLLVLPSALLTFLFLVLLRAVDPGVLRPSSSPPTPRTQTLLASHHSWYLAPKRYARRLVHADRVESYTPLLSQADTAATRDEAGPDSHSADGGAADEEGELVVQDWCFGCQIWRPPHAGHCRQCEVCVERFDHHCYVLGACIGRHNLLFFLLFLLAAGVSGLLLTASSLIMLLQRAPFTASSASEPLVWLGLVLTGSSLYICATLLFLAYHIHMLCTNTTTRQQHSHKHNQPTTPPHHTTPPHTGSPYQRLRSRWHDVLWPPGRRWQPAWVVGERSARRRVMETRWRREGVARSAGQQRHVQRQDAAGKEDSEGSVGSHERLWKGEEGEEDEVKEHVVSDDEDEDVEAESAMSVSSFLSGDDGRRDGGHTTGPLTNYIQ